MDFTQEQKDAIEGQIVDIVIGKMEKNELTEEESSFIADFILRKIDLIKNHDELIALLKELSSKWSFFENLVVVEEGEAKEKKEDVVAEQVLNLTKNGKINEAIQLAKTMTQK